MEAEKITIFDNMDLSEEVKQKTKVLFETAVKDEVKTKVQAIKEELEKEYNEKINEEVSRIHEEMETSIDTYLSYVVDEWVKENELAIENGIKVEIAENFVDGMKTIFTENYVDVPEDKVDVVAEMAEQIEEITSDLNSVISEKIELSKNYNDLQKSVIINEMCDKKQLTDVDKERVSELVEDTEFIDEESYKEKIGLITEAYFKEDKNKDDDGDEDDEKEKKKKKDEDDEEVNESVDVYLKALGR